MNMRRLLQRQLLYTQFREVKSRMKNQFSLDMHEVWRSLWSSISFFTIHLGIFPAK
jgi:hypothetical protein